ncbi:uncharacterized protein LOC133806845 [Humulus lupulus]|uniref:uncharacterized protein LOC133806845 n=1 Tax=Humulus lupulus TaxID=3486 RepID=UPI002B40F09B|nr:uncharacterized protein LOC133806845 [Humulus lupulus]
MNTRGRGSSSKSVKSQKETVPESVPTAIPHVPASIPAVSPSTGHRPKTTARKKVLALPGPEGVPLIGATSKGVTFPNLDDQQNLASVVPLASSEGQVKSNLALNTSHSQSVSTEAESDPSEHDSESSLSPDVLTPKAKGKRKSKAARTRRTKKAKAKINPPPCTSSEDVSPETEDSLPDLDPSLTEPIPKVPLEDLEEETESEEDPSETIPAPFEPKGTTQLAFTELSTKLTKQKGARVRTSAYVRGHWYKFSPIEIAKALNLDPVEIDDSIEFTKDQVLSELRPLKKSHETLTSPLVGPTYTIKEDHALSAARKVKGINLAGSGSCNVASDTPAVLTALASV